MACRQTSWSRRMRDSMRRSCSSTVRSRALTFTKAFTELGGTLAGTGRVPVRSPEFSSYMQRIKDAQPDAVFVFMPIGELVPQFLKAYADSGLKNTNIKLLGPGDLTDESVIDAAGE